DLAFFRDSAPFFFDHAYFELATLLRRMSGLGQLRWWALATFLAQSRGPDTAPGLHSLEQEEREWARDIVGGRAIAVSLATEAFPARTDDLRLQYLLAHVAAGLAFINKVPAVD